MSLEIHGVTVYDPKLLQNHISSYFKELLGTTNIRLLSLHPTLWSSNEKLTPTRQSFLEQPFILDEIKQTVFSCNPSKALGPDGMSFLFYQTYWDLLNLIYT